MFGNPNISATPVDDIYRTQADTFGNSFSNPLNPAALNPGWGIDPSLLTPGYTAPYRPSYNGPQPYNQFGRIGFFGGVNELVNPFGNDRGWGNPFMHADPSINAINTRPYDAAMWGVQRIAAPIAGFALANRALKSFGGGYSIGKRFGAGMGRGMATGFGLSSSGLTSRMMAGTLGAGMGLAASIGLPYAGMQAGMFGFERGISNPYINTRATSQDIYNNFSGVTFNDTRGNAVTGGGLGYGGANSIAQDITSQGINQFSFTTAEYGQMSSMMARSGLLDSAGAKGMSQRIKDGSAAVKMVMSLANMPEIREAVEAIAKLQMAGASISGGYTSAASTSMMQMSAMAKGAGASIQKIMNTVGMQGQYLYAANGMTPYLGQLAAASSYSAFSIGQRLGLIGPAQMARMGGLDGATQSSMTGQLNATQTIYNRISNFNDYAKGNRGGSVLSNIQRFGEQMSRDPVGTYGMTQMYGPQMGGTQMLEQGSMALERQLMEIAESAQMIPRGGKLRAEQAFPILTDVIGLSRDEAIAFLNERMTQGASGARELAMKGVNTAHIEASTQYIAQNSLHAGGLIGKWNALKRGGSKLADSANKTFVRPLTSMMAGGADGMTSAWHNFFYGGSTYTNQSTDLYKDLGLQRVEIDKMKDTSVADKLSLGERIGLGISSKNPAEVADVVNGLRDLVFKGDADAIAYHKTNDPDKRTEILNKMIRDGKFGSDAKTVFSESASAAAELHKYVQSRPETRVKDTVEYDLLANPGKGVRGGRTVGGADSGFIGEIGKIGKFGKDFESNIKSINLASAVAASGLTAISSSEELLKDSNLAEYMKLHKMTDPRQALDSARYLAREANEKGLTAFATVGADNLGKFTDKDLEKKANAAKAAGNMAEYWKYWSIDNANSRNGGQLRTGGNKGVMDQTDVEAQGSITIDRQFSQARNRIDQLTSQGRLDFTNSNNLRAALDNRESSITFKQAVQDFSKAVTVMTGKQVVPSGPYSGMESYKNGSIYQSLFGDNKKVQSQTSGNAK